MAVYPCFIGAARRCRLARIWSRAVPFGSCRTGGFLDPGDHGKGILIQSCEEPWTGIEELHSWRYVMAQVSIVSKTCIGPDPGGRMNDVFLPWQGCNFPASQIYQAVSLTPTKEKNNACIKTRQRKGSSLLVKTLTPVRISHQRKGVAKFSYGSSTL